MADSGTRWSLLFVLFLCHLQGLCSASTNGFLSQNEVESAAENNEGVSTQERLQLIFPSINFTESQSIMSWSFVAKESMDPERRPENLLQLQVWRRQGNSYSLVANIGNTSILRSSGRLYQYVLPAPISVLPGDVLGIHIPQLPGILLHFRDVGEGNTSTYYLQVTNIPLVFITDINMYTPASRLVPLVAVQFATPPTSSPAALSSTIALSSSTPIPPSSTSAPPTSSTPEAVTSTLAAAAPPSSTLAPSSTAFEIPTTPLAEETSSFAPSSTPVQVSSTVVVSSSQFVSPSQQASTMETDLAPSETLTQEITNETPTTTVMAGIAEVTSLLRESPAITPPALLPSLAALSTSLPSSVSSSLTSTPSLQAENATVMLVTSIVGCLFAVMILVLLAVLIALLVMNKRRRKGSKDVKTSILEARESPTNGLVPNHLDNPTYQGVVISGDSPTITIDANYDTVNHPSDVQQSNVPYQTATSLDLWNDLYTSNKTQNSASQSSLYQEPQTLPLAAQDEGHYEMASPYEQPVASNSVPHATSEELSHYELPSRASSLKSNNKRLHQYSTLDHEGLYVPSEEQRTALGINQSSVFDDDSYEEWGKNHTKTEQADKMAFFEQSDIYWRPATQAAVLYDQLATKKYREIKRSEIQIVRHLGAGQFGTVNEGVWHCQWGKQPVAVKMLRVKAAEEEKVKLLQEAAIMGQFVHPNVVRLHGVVTVGEPVMIAIELMNKGDLKNHLRSIRADPSRRSAEDLPARLIKCCRQVAAGMVYLSKKSFVHRDLAARNILVNEHETCKIGDFGMSRDLEDENYYVSHGGKIPVKWTAPEALHYKKYSTASDVWSFGVLMYEIWSLGRKPFEEFSNPVAIKLVESGYRLPPPPGCSRAVYQLMVQCWHPEGAARPTFSSVLSTLSHPIDQLLHWTEGDKAAHQHADWLGGSLEVGQYLYRDLQHAYFSNKAEL